jgi:UDPglucose 6-dehydrogenase
MQTVGIIGGGFVGNAVAHGFRRVTGVKVYDVDPDKATHHFNEVAEQDFVFVCVPTPTNAESGDQDTSILRSVVHRIEAAADDGWDVGTVVVKSTVLPGVVINLVHAYPGLRFLSNPEFLMERTAVYDFRNPKRVVIGSDLVSAVHAMDLEELYREMLGPMIQPPFIHVKHDTAALIKYASNCFSAVKISFFNHVKQICDKLGLNYADVLHGVLGSGWVNPMHTRVPGPDGRPGFGGKCFPKDMMALARYMAELDLDAYVIHAALALNDKIRTDRDWERIDGALSCD